MSDRQDIVMAAGDDPEMLAAYEKARRTFGFFWKEAAMDFNRIIPALSLACVKALFTDNADDPEAPVEHMWVDEVDFDGEHIQGVLASSPNSVRSVESGDEVSLAMKELSDWMFVINDKAYGGFTVQVLRSRMSLTERKEHDGLWGFDFGNPDEVRTPPDSTEFENNLVKVLQDYLDEAPVRVHEVDELGRTALHREALNGRLPTAMLLLERGADVNAKCAKGWTPLKYASALQWTGIMDALQAHGGGLE
ncbi:MAG: DUF2314 domain-containing protein [Gemmataceae bacterium]